MRHGRSHERAGRVLAGPARGEGGGRYRSDRLARVLREIDADRLLLRQYEDAVERCLPYGDAPRGEVHGLRFAVKCLVSVYADHADYRKDLAPVDTAQDNREDVIEASS
jgi:hypothetical protein